ncbi:MAG: 4Fe-4S dicluster domain-containing protein [Nitrospirota bacterium]
MSTTPAANRKAILVTPEVCIGCRGCQTACKSWNQLPGIPTKNRGSAQNPPDLESNTYNIIRYSELPSENNPVRWLFISRRCMHCDDAGCMKICPAPGALYKTREGAVAFDRDKCIGCRLCVAGCPFDVPRYDKNNKVMKCHLCYDRIAEGLEPACSKACPTGALRFGDRDKLIESARKAGHEKIYGEADLGGLGSIFAFKDAPKIYGYAEKPGIPESVVFWHTVLKPFAVVGLGGAVAAALLHYVIVGPHREEEVQ